MRRIASTALIAVLLALAPAGAAFSQENAEQANPPAVSATVQAQDNENEDDDNTGLWGLLGLLGLAGLIPWRKKRDHGHQESTTRHTGM
ncbi:WGxxGxxG family protein [Streptomyces sp.]|uniref:WGxxGxxG family protein n=1 Tax=Streptomyces sp. TaxID=1931 RepID=UPI0028124146|nr:WGxxGxxG family protein [Streptomyces sp.]